MKPQEHAENAQFSILLVEDDPGILRLFEGLLSSSGFVVHAAADGMEALRKFDRERIDLVLTDICLPGLDGNLLLQYIRSLRRDIPVVAMSATPWRADSNFDLILTKPMNLKYFIDSIKTLLSGRERSYRNNK